MASYPVPAHQPHESGVGYKLLAVFLALVVCVMGFFGLWLALSAQHARDDANKAAASAATATPASSSSMPGMSTAAGASAAEGSYASPSFAGIAPANADALAMAHAAYPAALAPAPAGPVAAVAPRHLARRRLDRAGHQVRRVDVRRRPCPAR